MAPLNLPYGYRFTSLLRKLTLVKPQREESFTASTLAVMSQIAEITPTGTSEQQAPAVAQPLLLREAPFSEEFKFDKPMLPNGACYKALFVPQDRHFFTALPPWPSREVILSTAVETGARVFHPSVGFSLQLEGKWALKLRSQIPGATYAHINYNGAASATKLLTSPSYEKWHFGGRLGLQQAKTAGLAPPDNKMSFTFLSFLLFSVNFFSFYFDFIFVNLGNYGRDLGIFKHPKTLGMTCLTIPFSTPYKSCMYTALLDLGLSPVDLLINNIYPWTTSLARVDKRYVKSLGLLPLYWSFTGGKFGHVSSTWFPGSRFIFNPLLARSVSFGAEPGATSSWYAPPVAQLGGAKPMLTQIPVTTKSNNFSTPWSARFWPTQAVEAACSWTQADNGESFGIERTSEFMRHFPKNLNVNRLPQFFTHTSFSEFFWRARPAADGLNIVDTTSNRPWTPYSVAGRLTSTLGSSLGPLLAGNVENEARSKAQQTLSAFRFLSTRGNRTIPHWEAEDTPRSLALANFLQRASRVQDYRTVAVRLWSRLLLRVAQDAVSERERQVGGQPFVWQSATGANAQLTWLTATLPAPAAGPGAPPPANPEAPMWDDVSQDALLNGTKQFIDVLGLSRGEVVELVSAMDPMLQVNFPAWRHNNNDYMSGLSRYVHTNDTTEIFLHTGNNDAAFSAADRAWIQQHVHAEPSIVNILSVMRQLIALHDCLDDFKFGFEVAINRFATFRSGHAKTLAGNAQHHYHFSGDGNVGLDLPRTYTPSAYYAVLLQPGVIDPEMLTIMQSTQKFFLNNACLLLHSQLVSLNWAAYSSSLYGRLWNNLPGQEPDPRIRNHIDSIRRTYALDPNNLWSAIANNALAHQYGYGVSPNVRMTTQGSLLNIFADFSTPWFANPYIDMWMIDFIPTFQILPYFDDINHQSRVGMDINKPFPIQDDYTFDGRVKLSRERDFLNGLMWLNDGGFTRNAQFFAAQGDANSLFRFENGDPNISLRRWTAQLNYEFPNAPAAQPITWMGGRQSPFGDFILPGSILNFDVATGRTRAYGIATDNAAQLTAVRRRWIAQARGDDMSSLMVNYIHPMKEQRELLDLPDYSAIIWETDSAFSGISIVRHDLPNFEVDARFNDAIPLSSVSLNAAYSGDPMATRAPARVTRAAKSTNVSPGSRVARILPRQSYRPVTPPNDNTLVYEAKGALTAQDVPPLMRGAVDVSDQGITPVQRPPYPSRPVSPPHDPSDDLYPKINSDFNRQLDQIEASYDDDFNNYLREDANRKRLLAAEADQAVRHARTRVQRALRQPRPRSGMVRVNQASAPSAQQSSTIAPRQSEAPPAERPTFEVYTSHDMSKVAPDTVAANDAAAYEAQRRAFVGKQVSFSQTPDQIFFNTQRTMKDVYNDEFPHLPQSPAPTQTNRARPSSRPTSPEVTGNISPPQVNVPSTNANDKPFDYAPVQSSDKEHMTPNGGRAIHSNLTTAIKSSEN